MSDALSDADAREEAIELENDAVDSLVNESQEVSDEGVDGDEGGRQPQGSIQLTRHGRARLEGRRNGSGGAAADFERDESGDGQSEKNRQRHKETGLDGENRRGQHASESQDGEKREIAIGARGVKANERGEKHQVNGCE